jgi:tRNA(Ile)-lysidine synthase
MPLISELGNWLSQNVSDNSQVIVGYSGGLDSQTLLYALNKLRKSRYFNLLAIHVNHNLSKNSDKWQLHCEDFCKLNDINFITESICISKSKDTSLEMACREARYQVFKKNTDKNTIIVTAHHQDDQAETLLLQLVRGSGVQGLGAIKPMQNFYDGSLARPLLNISKEDISKYAEDNNLKFCTDESNSNLNFRRNFMRHKVLVMLEELYPGVKSSIARSAYLCSQTHTMLDNYLADDYKLIAKNNCILLDKFKLFSKSKQSELLRYWLRKQKASMPSHKKCMQILLQVTTAKHDSNPFVKWQNYTVHRYKNELHLETDDKTIDLNNLQWQLVQGRGIKSSEFKPEISVCKHREGGEKLPQPGGWHKSLKKVLQEFGIPPWLRSKLPLIYVKDEFIALGNFVISERWKVRKADEWGWEIVQ